MPVQGHSQSTPR